MSVSTRWLTVAIIALPLVAFARFAQRPAADFSGHVFLRSGQPVAGVDVSLPALSKSTVTNDSGAFRFSDIPVGQHEMRVRKIGFQESIEHVTVSAGGTSQYRVVLQPVQTLTPVTVEADPVMADFEENRKIGLGRFMTRSELEKVEHRKLGEVIEAVGAKVSRSGPFAWLGSTRGPIRSLNQGIKPKCSTLEGRPVSPRDSQSARNPGCGQCWAQVWIDGRAVYSGEEGGVVPDLNAILPQSIEAIEYYKGPASTPMKYSKLNSQCGVLVIHTRRSLGETKKP
jgi:hypothetical protein